MTRTTFARAARPLRVLVVALLLGPLALLTATPAGADGTGCAR